LTNTIRLSQQQQPVNWRVTTVSWQAQTTNSSDRGYSDSDRQWQIVLLISSARTN